jgi:hypothetical protein
MEQAKDDARRRLAGKALSSAGKNFPRTVMLPVRLSLPPGTIRRG